MKMKNFTDPRARIIIFKLFEGEKSLLVRSTVCFFKQALWKNGLHSKVCYIAVWINDNECYQKFIKMELETSGK